MKTMSYKSFKINDEVSKKKSKTLSIWKTKIEIQKSWLLADH